MPSRRPLFSLGSLVMTPGAREALDDSGETPVSFLRRHIHGDWGNLDEEDLEANDHAVEKRLRILSSYMTKKGVKFWVITEADRSSSCLLLPSEY